ncbi:MAG: hypothetical protein JNM72_12030 [Deltaproteobacteria bacterium]|nr:hypothetical protein [Deltaproteobacteria bacterium]
MARSAAERLAQAMRFLPPAYAPLEPLLAAVAGSLATVEGAADLLAATSTVEGAAGRWLELLAAGAGLQRADGEVDAALRARLRTPEAMLTRAALIEVLEQQLAPYAAPPPTLLEWFDPGAWVGHDAYVGLARTRRWRTVAAILPVGPAAWEGAFAGAAWSGRAAFARSYVSLAFSGLAWTGAAAAARPAAFCGVLPHPAIAPARAALARRRAAGVRAYVVLDTPEPR